MSTLSWHLHLDSYRPDSQDRGLVLETERGLVIAVTDGVGGRAGGGEAAEHAIARMREWAASGQRRGPRHLQKFVEQLDAELSDDPVVGETTLVVLEVAASRISGVSVGDSEAWLVLPGGHFDLTKYQYRKPFLGSGGAVIKPFSIHRPEFGTLVVATDGLFKYTSPAQVENAALLPDLAQSVRTLGDLPRLRSGALPDDLSVGVCRFGDAPPGATFDRFSFWSNQTMWVPTIPDEDR